MSLKILHTSDWHLAHQWMGKSRLEEHRAFFDWLVHQVEVEAPDALLVSGDLFDHGLPPHEVQGLYLESLLRLEQAGCKNIILTAGNHDSVSFLDASKKLFEKLGIRVISKLSDRLEDHLLPIHNGDGKVLAQVMAFPYFRERELRVLGSGGDIQSRHSELLSAMSKIFKELCELARKINDNIPLLAMAHFFAVGSSMGDSERELYLGELEAVPLDELGESWDYLALGHLHRTQKVGGQENVWYSGTPIPMSFSESPKPQNILKVIFDDEKKPVVEKIEIPRFRDVFSLKCHPDQLEEKLLSLETSSTLNTWLELQLTARVAWDWVQNLIEKALEDKPVDVLAVKTVLENVVELDHKEEYDSLELLTPQSLFEQHLDELQLEAEAKAQLIGKFKSVCEELAEEGASF